MCMLLVYEISQGLSLGPKDGPVTRPYDDSFQVITANLISKEKSP